MPPSFSNLIFSTLYNSKQSGPNACMLDYLRSDYSDDSPDGLFRPLKVEFTPYISKKLQEIAKTMGITEKETLKQLVEDNLETMEKAEARFKMLEERSKRKHRGTGT